MVCRGYVGDAQIAECKVQVGHVYCLFVCDATLGRKRLPRLVRKRDLRAVIQQLRKPGKKDNGQNHGLRQNTRGVLLEDSGRYSRCIPAAELSAPYSHELAGPKLHNHIEQ
eukprot:3911485-Rhodomonas_salina.1